jgi:HEAT repeat protein
MNPQLPPLLRKRALVNLVESGDPNIALLFKQAIQQGDLQARALSVYGLGLLGREQDLAQIETVMEGADPLVQLAAAESLKNHGSQKALEILVSIVLVSEDEVQRLAAEALARFGEDGYAVLREAAEDEDLIIRRAAVYGLSAVDQDWAWAIVEKMLHDKEWFVRNAAEALLTAHEQKPELGLSLPKPEDESWLISWAAARGEGVGAGDMAVRALMQAAQDEDPEVRWMAVNSLRRLLSRRSVDALRQALRDPEPLVRQTAFIALEEISRRHNLLISAT